MKKNKKQKQVHVPGMLEKVIYMSAAPKPRKIMALKSPFLKVHYLWLNDSVQSVSLRWSFFLYFLAWVDK